MTERPPLYDDSGINLADPHDRLGRKTQYITELQTEAMRSVLGDVSGLAVDVGCGYGRMSRCLGTLGFDKVIGIDPSARVLAHAKELHPDIEFRVGSLPDLPVEKEGAAVVFLLNVARALHLSGCLSIAAGCADAVAPQGRLVVIDNLRKGHAGYFNEHDLVTMFERRGMRLEHRCAIRGARWPWVPLLQFGLLPRVVYRWLSRFERTLMAKRPQAVSWHYINVLWVFRKP